MCIRDSRTAKLCRVLSPRIQLFETPGDRLSVVFMRAAAQSQRIDAVSYTHLDVYKRQDHGDAQLDELSGQVQVALDVGAINDVQDGVGLLLDVYKRQGAGLPARRGVRPSPAAG